MLSVKHVPLFTKSDVLESPESRLVFLKVKYIVERVVCYGVS